MVLKFKSHHIEAEDICVGIGPCIGDCCYDVPKERVNAFTGKYSYPNIYQDKGGKYFLDLKKIGLSILLENGVKRKILKFYRFAQDVMFQIFIRTGQTISRLLVNLLLLLQ